MSWFIKWFFQGDSAGVWSKRVDEVNQQLRKSEAEKNNLSKNLQAAEKECSAVKSRLQELDKALSGNDSVSKELEEKLKVTNIWDHSSSNPFQGEVYNIMWSSLSVTCSRSVVSSRYTESSNNKTDCHDIAEILLKVGLNTINPTNQSI